MTIARKFGGFTSATVIKLLVSTIKLPSESSAMTLRLGKALVSPRAKGIQSPMLQPKKFAPSRLKSDQKAVFDERLVTVSICSSTISAKSFRQSKRFITNLRVGIRRRVYHHEGDKFSVACKIYEYSPRSGPKSSPPNILIGGPLPISPGFPLRTCGNDGVRTPRLCGKSQDATVHLIIQPPLCNRDGGAPRP